MATSDSSANRYELTDPDVRLMLQVRDDNAVAFEELVTRYQHRLVAILKHLVHRQEQAEDLAQEVFLRVYRARKGYTANAKFSTWLFTIANNVASNARRAAARRKEVQVARQEVDQGSPQPLEQMALDASGQRPSRQLAKLERSEVLHVAIQTLNDQQRMALLLSKFEGMSYAEIGDAMGLSIQATKSLLARARENLRVLLGPYMEEGALPTDAADA